jgi:hypothetical protein
MGYRVALRRPRSAVGACFQSGCLEFEIPLGNSLRHPAEDSAEDPLELEE